MPQPKPDTNFLSYADQSGVVLEHQVIDPADPENYDDILKISNCHDVVVRNCWINTGGGNREDGIDIMRTSSNVRIENTIVAAGSKYAFTIKGGSYDIALKDITITRGGSGWEGVDIDLGNYSSTCPDIKTGRVTLDNVRRWDGKPVRIRVGWAADPVIIGGNCKVLGWQSLALKLYVQIMRKLGGAK